MDADAGVAGDAGGLLPTRPYPCAGGEARSVRLRARAKTKALAGNGDRGAAAPPSPPSPFALLPLPGRDGVPDGPALQSSGPM